MVSGGRLQDSFQRDSDFQIKTGVLFGLAFFLIFYFNILLAYRMSSRPLLVFDRDQAFNLTPWEIPSGPLRLLITCFSILIGIIAAFQGASEWENFLLFQSFCDIRCVGSPF